MRPVAQPFNATWALLMAGGRRAGRGLEGADTEELAGAVAGGEGARLFFLGSPRPGPHKDKCCFQAHPRVGTLGPGH